MKRTSIKISALAVTTLLAGSVLATSPAQALVTPTATIASSNATTALATYKIDYAAWLVSLKAWNAARALEATNHVVARGTYSSLVLSNKTATTAITALRLSLMTAPNNDCYHRCGQNNNH